ncbi:MAG: peptidylprolyl isomerase [Myxococcales bacterium]|nr:peptidylprolyl isomerase [Myxococcales bacterium]
MRDGHVVSLQYILRNDEGVELDRSGPGDPLVYLHGASNIVPGLEEKLTGATKGATVRAVVPPERGYGPRVEGAVQRVPRSAFAPDAQIEEGMQVVGESDDGQALTFFVTEVAPETIVLDGNHPLAGETLHFECTVEDIREATDEERSHGHVHGPHGHG